MIQETIRSTALINVNCPPGHV